MADTTTANKPARKRTTSTAGTQLATVRPTVITVPQAKQQQTRRKSTGSGGADPLMLMVAGYAVPQVLPHLPAIAQTTLGQAALGFFLVKGKLGSNKLLKVAGAALCVKAGEAFAQQQQLASGTKVTKVSGELEGDL